jgi:hypothetical protein
VAGDRNSGSFLPVEPAEAEILATDTRGRPALLLRPGGRGSLISCTYPIEHMAALTPRVNPDDSVALYAALATHAGLRRPVTVDDPRVAADTLVRDDGTLFAVLASVTLGPFGINVLRITGSGATDAGRGSAGA